MSVESLTDSELRTKLAEYGYPVGPVTQTTRKILVKKLKSLIDSRSGSRHSLAARYSSDDTDDDIGAAINKKKKATSTSRRQTMANPMPPPAVAPPPVASSVSRSPSKRRAGSRNSETKETSDYEDATVNSTSRTVKTVQKKTKSFKLSTVNDGLETGSDSDIPEDSDKRFPTKFGVEAPKPSYDSRKDRNSADVETTVKTYESRTRGSNLLREDKYTVPPFKPNISPIAPIKDDSSYKREDLNVNDILATYESPYLSEFTRRLSTQTGSSAPSRSNFKSSMLRHTTHLRPENKESDTNGHFSSLRSSYNATNSRYVSSSNDRSRDVVTRAYKAPATKQEEGRNNQNVVSMVLVIGLALFFGVLAIVYLGLGGKTESVPSLPMGRYSD
uniref:Emr-1 protein n=2 Tax=Fopius arisanus TaxID=64838 RepID=A0A0C9QAQ6_9HYME